MKYVVYCKWSTTTISVGKQMFLGMQDYNFAQIQLNLLNSNNFA